MDCNSPDIVKQLYNHAIISQSMNSLSGYVSLYPILASSIFDFVVILNLFGRCFHFKEMENVSTKLVWKISDRYHFIRHRVTFIILLELYKICLYNDTFQISKII